MRDPYIYIDDMAFPKARITNMGYFVQEEYLGEEFEPKPLKAAFWCLVGGLQGYVAQALESFNDIHSIYAQISYFVIVFDDGSTYASRFGKGCWLSVRDTKKMLKDFKRHPESYACILEQ